MTAIDPGIARSSTGGKPIKKALLIGSGLQGAPKPQGCPEYPPLGRAVKDTRALAALLNSAYGYPKENIVVLVDAKGVDPKLAPTKANILRELDTFAQGAKPGDHFFFFFAGHSGRGWKLAEDDAELVQYVVPCDYWDYPEEVPISERTVLSHELRKFLVDSLPVDAGLYAIFDACDSGRLLELLHYRCNDIYIPWISPGYRRYMTQWRGVRRRDGCIMDDIELALGKTLSSQASVDNSATPTNGRRSSASSIRIIQSKRLSQDEVQTVDTSVKIVNGKGKHRQVSITRRQSSMQRRTSSSLLQIVEDAHSAIRTESPDAFDDLHLRRCTSPTEETDCNGFDCGPSDGHEVAAIGPNVVSMASSRESQRTWDTKSYSFTQALIRALRIDPHQTIAKLVDTLTFGAYTHGRKLHAWSQKRRTSWKQKIVDSADYDPAHYIEASADAEMQNALELLNYSEPQVGSQRPMVLQQIFDP